MWWTGRRREEKKIWKRVKERENGLRRGKQYDWSVDVCAILCNCVFLHRFVVVSCVYRIERVIENAGPNAIAKNRGNDIWSDGKRSKGFEIIENYNKNFPWIISCACIQTFSFRPFDRIKSIRPTSFRSTLRMK